MIADITSGLTSRHHGVRLSSGTASGRRGYVTVTPVTSTLPHALLMTGGVPIWDNQRNTNREGSDEYQRQEEEASDFLDWEEELTQ